MKQQRVTPLMILQYLQTFKESIEGKMDSMEGRIDVLEEKVDRGFREAREERIALHEDLVETMRVQGIHDVKIKKLGRLVGAK